MSLTAPIRLRVVPRLIPVDGKNVELRSTSDAVEWRNEGDANWQVLVPISELIGPEGPKGDKGDAGQDGIMASIQPGDNVAVDATDPANPVISTPSVSYGISQSLSTSQRLQAQANIGLADLATASEAANFAAAPYQKFIRTAGLAASGDGGGGIFIDEDNGTGVAFTTLDGRPWYRAFDNLTTAVFCPLVVVSRQLTAPPATPSNYDRYIVAATATGAWEGQENNIAAYIGGDWLFFPPVKGQLAGCDQEDTTLRYNGSAWVSATDGSDFFFTPTLIGLTAGTAVLSQAQGWAYKIGNQVTLGVHVIATDTAALSGQLAVGGIPAALAPRILPGTAGRVAAEMGLWRGITLPAGSIGIKGFFQEAGRIRFYRNILNAGNQTVTNAHITSTSGEVEIYLSCSYRSAN